MSSSMASSRLLRRDLMTAKSSADQTSENVQRPSADFRLSVSFPPLLSLQRVEKVRVELAPTQPPEPGLVASRKSPLEVIPLRLDVPGALVTPAHQEIEPLLHGPAQVIFYVTPLAEGILPAARLEFVRSGRTEAIDLPLRARSRRRGLWIAILVMVPLLLWLPTVSPSLARGLLERRLLLWLPSDLDVCHLLAHLAQNAYSFQAHQGAQNSLSFWSLVVLPTGTWAWRLLRRLRFRVVHTASFRLPSTAKTNTPPPLLMPLNEQELAEIGKPR